MTAKSQLCCIMEEVACLNQLQHQTKHNKLKGLVLCASCSLEAVMTLLIQKANEEYLPNFQQCGLSDAIKK